MNYTTITFIIILIIINIVFNKIFKNSILKIFKTIKYLFVPYGLIMWAFEIFITKKVAISQFGFIYSIFSFSLLGVTWIIFKVQSRFGNINESRALGLVYSSVFVLLLLGFILGSGFVDTYLLHIYSLP